MTSSALQPIDPVDPRMAIRLGKFFNIARRAQPRYDTHRFTRREMQTEEVIAAGFSPRVIADER